jgi:hypothetical protein
MNKSILARTILLSMAHGAGEANEETTAVEATVVRPDTEKYTKSTSANGSSTLHNGDVVATGLASLTLAETFAVASKLLGSPVATLELKYAHLNLGMQRMNLGNRIRGAIALISKGNAKDIAKIEKANLAGTAKYDKAVVANQKAHDALVKQLGEDEKAPLLVAIVAFVPAKVPALVEGAGEKAFTDAIAEFGDAIEKRKVSAELIVKEKADKKAKADADKKAKAVKKEADAKAKAKAKADADAKTGDAGTDVGTAK